MNIENNEILITGGGSGLGFALAKELIARGNKVLICDVSKEKVGNALKQIPGIRGMVCDLSKEENYPVLFRAALKELPGINMVINNAGICQELDYMQEIPKDLFSREIMVNFMAPLEMTRLFLPLLLERESSAIINIVSKCGVRPFYAIPLYSATKAGLSFFTEGLRNRLRHTLGKNRSVKIIEVYPPTIDSQMNAKWTGVKKVPPDIAARAILNGVLKNREIIWVSWNHVRVYWFITRWLIRILRFPGKYAKVIFQK